ncbi:DUF3445 domain-containing protein [Streptomyces sp. NPDC056165]|uniref:heme-dependent oxidative N-demethylase family protein n=1 Tax=Streptomyces sp. NPDC056165 TaxID=3345733 RepID=UPI0035DAA1D4
MNQSAQPTHPARIARYPFPLDSDSYRYIANVEPARTLRHTAAGEWGAHLIDIDSEYLTELAERERILAADPGRRTLSPHAGPLAWDALLTVLRELAATYPESMQLHQERGQWHWRNALLGHEHRFRYGDDETLPQGCPLAFLGSQIQEDITILDQRGGELWLEGGLVTFASNWSLAFDTGMSFMEIHGPVPRDYADGTIPRAEQFLMRLRPGDGYRRTNWTSTVRGRLDTSLESYADWAPDQIAILSGDIGRELFLRTEVQHLLRLPDTGGIAFFIRTYLLSFGEIATVPQWRTRLAAVLAELPQEMAQYKGFAEVRDLAVDWLQHA